MQLSKGMFLFEVILPAMIFCEQSIQIRLTKLFLKCSNQPFRPPTRFEQLNGEEIFSNCTSFAFAPTYKKNLLI